MLKNVNAAGVDGVSICGGLVIECLGSLLNTSVKIVTVSRE